MRKLRFLFIIMAIMFLVSGCSTGNGNNKLSLEIKHNKENDEIKFLRIDWLTEKKEVDKIIDEKFGTDYMIISGLNAPYNNVNNIEYHNKENKDIPLLWDIGGQEINYLWLQYYTPDNGQNNYLYKVQIRYDNPSTELYYDLKYKLDNLYTKVKEEDEDYGYGMIYKSTSYTDKNMNELSVNYGKAADSFCTIDYRCKDVDEFIDSEIERLLEELKQEKKTEQREITPDL